MDRRILVLAAATFAMGTEAYVYAGHLDALARDLGWPVAAAGQVATAFALTYALSAPLTAVAAARFGRRGTLVMGVLVIGALNGLAALAPTLEALIGIRVACGLAAGLVGPIATTAAAELAPPDRRGRALAVVLAGTTLAFVLGIPVGSVVGDVFGWRGTFAYAGLVAVAAALAIRLVLPAMPGSEPRGFGAFRDALRPAALGPLSLTLVGFVATFCAVAYVGPLVTGITGFTGSGVGAMQAMIGVGSILGVALGGRLADRGESGRALAVSFLASAAALSAYSLLLVLPQPHALAVALLTLGMTVGAAALFSRTPVIQARLVAATPPSARPVVLALNGSMIFLGQGLGAAAGGATLAAGGLSWIGFVAAAIALGGAGLARSLRRSPEAAIPGPLVLAAPERG